MIDSLTEEEWIQKSKDIVPDSLHQWSNSVEDLRSLYHEFKGSFPPQLSFDVIRCRFVSTIFPVLMSMYALARGQEGSTSKEAINSRTSKRQLQLLSQIIATEDTSQEEIGIIKDNLDQWTRTGRRWRTLAHQYGSGCLFQVGEEIDEMISKRSIPRKYLETIATRYPHSYKLNTLGDAILESLIVPVRDHQQELRDIEIIQKRESWYTTKTPQYQQKSREKLAEDDIPSNTGPEDEFDTATFLQHIISCILEGIPPSLIEMSEGFLTNRVLTRIVITSISKGLQQDDDPLAHEAWALLWRWHDTIVRDIANNIERQRRDYNKAEHTAKPDMFNHDMLDAERDGTDDSTAVPGLEDSVSVMTLNPPIEEQDESNMLVYVSAVTKDAAFVWLIERLKRELTFANGNADILDDIFQMILSHNKVAAFSKITRGTKPNNEHVQIDLHLDWDLPTYVDDTAIRLAAKGFSSKDWLSIESLGSAITLTGSATDALALTCFEYLDLVWPEIGRKVLKLVQTSIQMANGSNPVSDALPNHATLSLQLEKQVLKTRISGPTYSVDEVTQVLVWLSSTFRNPDISPGVVICEPVLNQVQSRTYRIDYRMYSCLQQSSGQCWYDMLHNPIVVLGFPTIRRPRSAKCRGLELSLPIIAALIQSTKLVVLDGICYLKGFSSMLVPTGQERNIINWHYVFNKDGSYVSFADENIRPAVAIDTNKIATFRHIVGWATEVKVTVGTKDVTDAIARPKLEKTSSSIVFKAFSLSIGQYISLGTSVSFSVKDPPLHVAPAGLGITDQLLFIEDKFVVLWDSKHDRGWLVDGVSALLHLLRYSLRALESSRLLKKSLCLQDGDIHEPKTPYPQAASDFFTDENHWNLRQELYLRKFESSLDKTARDPKDGEPKIRTTMVLLQDRVEHLWQIIAQMITQQIEFAKRDGRYYKPSFRDTLEGWDFLNLACHQSPFEPIAKKLDCFSEPWVHLIRSINAIVLFAEDFGELIEPTDACATKLCPEWRNVPTNMNYLVVPMATLKDIEKRHGRPGNSPMEISKGFVWYQGTGGSRSCISCQQNKETAHAEPVQIIWPTSLAPTPQIISQPSGTEVMSDNAAIIFGRNANLGWWQDMKGKMYRVHAAAKRKTKRQGQANSTKKAKRNGVVFNGIGLSASPRMDAVELLGDLPSTSAGQSETSVTNPQVVRKLHASGKPVRR